MDNWKRGHVVPIYKKGCHKQASNYCPITLTSIVGKLLESIVRDSLLTHFNTHDLLSNNQHGFFPGRSCVTQLLSVLDDWTRAMMEGHNTNIDVVYFDFSKAFDTVPHKHLMALIGFCIHCLTVFSISSFNPGHQTYILARAFILAIPGCPSCSSVNTAS